MRLLGDLLYEATSDLPIQAIGGLEVGAIPDGGGRGDELPPARPSDRGVLRPQGSQGARQQAALEGEVKAGDRVAVIDDVLTTGGSVVQAIQEIEKLGAIVSRVVCVVDRLQGSREALAGYDFRPIFTIRDFGIAGRIMTDRNTPRFGACLMAGSFFYILAETSGRHSLPLRCSEWYTLLSIRPSRIADPDPRGLAGCAETAKEVAMSTASKEPKLEVVRENDLCLIRFANSTSFNEYTADGLGQQLSSLPLDRPDQTVILDLTNVEYLTSTVLGHLVSLHKRLKIGGGHLKLQNPRPAIANVFRVTQLDHVLEVT